MQAGSNLAYCFCPGHNTHHLHNLLARFQAERERHLVVQEEGCRPPTPDKASLLPLLAQVMMQSVQTCDVTLDTVMAWKQGSEAFFHHILQGWNS